MKSKRLEILVYLEIAIATVLGLAEIIRVTVADTSFSLDAYTSFVLKILVAYNLCIHIHVFCGGYFPTMLRQNRWRVMINAVLDASSFFYLFYILQIQLAAIFFFAHTYYLMILLLFPGHYLIFDNFNERDIYSNSKMRYLKIVSIFLEILVQGFGLYLIHNVTTTILGGLLYVGLWLVPLVDKRLPLSLPRTSESAIN